MAGSVGNGDGPVAAINVTPLVDVMLVLLIIFMVTAPMLQQGVDVNLPKAATGALQGKNEQVVVSIDKAGKVYIGKGNEVALSAVPEKIAAIMKVKPAAEQKVYIKADQALDYGKVMELMSYLHKGGVAQIGLVSEAPAETTSDQKKK